MFGFLPPPLPQSEPPKDVPPPTPVNFPHYAPEITATTTTTTTTAPAGELANRTGKKSRLTDVLQSIVRPADLRVKHFEALGVRIRENADVATLIPNHTQHVPDFATWDDIPYDQARDINESTRRPISNGNRSPGIQIYLDRKRELSVENAAAFRTVRRLPAAKLGLPPVRLGNAYEFYRHLDSYSAFWDDTSVPAPPPPVVGEAPPGAAPPPPSDAVASEGTKPPVFAVFRSSAGSQMPPEYRLNMITAFLKLVAYDFGCNVTGSRTEPRLYLNTGTVSIDEAEAQDKLHKEMHADAQKAVAKDGVPLPPPPPPPPPPLSVAPSAAPPASVPASVRYKGPCSYFSSGAIFIFRSPTTREAARAGIVEGPLAAVTARHTTSFLSNDEYAALPNADADRDSILDLARELIAALITAQHRAREGRAERRIGKGEWWTTKPRWGGGAGGPIGREVDSAPNTDEPPSYGSDEGRAGSALGASQSTKPHASSSGGGGGGGGIPGGGNPSGYSGINTLASITGLPLSSSSSSSSRSGSAPKKQRKGLAMYDNYRMVRPPSSSWDKKTRYMAIGRDRHADYDDIFVVSSLFHHVSFVRVRVPQSLLDELDGAPAPAPAAAGDIGEAHVADSSLRGLEVVRSPWYDLFKTEDRLAAMRMAWGMMAYMMRTDSDDGSGSGGSGARGPKTGDDVPMKDA